MMWIWVWGVVSILLLGTEGEVLMAKAVVENNEYPGDRVRLGTVTFEQDSDSNIVKISGSISGLKPGKHGFHIHELGDLAEGCPKAMAHYNPYKKNHGAPYASVRHVGDLGNIVADRSGTARLALQDTGIQLVGPHSIIGRAIMVHAGEDDLGLGGNAESLKTGNAGSRVGCGVIGIGSKNFSPQLLQEMWSRSMGVARNEAGSVEFCKDGSGYCGPWSQMGYCSPGNRYFPYMQTSCKRACGFC